MWKGLISDLKLHRDDLLMPLVVIPVWLCGFVICCVIMSVIDDPGGWATFGSMMAFVMLVVFAGVTFAKFHQECMLALSMGRTRTEFLLSYALRTFVWLFFGYVLVQALYRVELRLGTMLFRPWPLEVDLGFLMDLRLGLVLIPGVTLLSMFVGTLYSRFGQKMMVPFWITWMAVCLLPSAIPEEGEHVGWLGRTLLDAGAFFGRLPTAVWIGVGGAAVITMIATVIAVGKKQMVR